MDLPPTQQRVKYHTSEHSNQTIEEETDRSLQYYRHHPEEIDQRLLALSKEWDVERALEANASTLILASSALGFFVSRKFFAVPAVVSAFLLQHALQGWCPPLPVLRHLGYRTTSEIQREREALESLRPKKLADW